MAQWDPANWPPHIHQSKEVSVDMPEEVPVADIAAMAYPTDGTDNAICAAALSVVEQSGGLSSMEHLDALLLATHPDWCKAFLDKSDLATFENARTSAPADLFVGQGQSIRWTDCRDHLERLNALRVAYGAKGQPISADTGMAMAQGNLPGGVVTVVQYALKALDRVRDLRRDLDSAPQPQQDILRILSEQHRLCGLAA
jgi:hypothetical protein